MKLFGSRFDHRTRQQITNILTSLNSAAKGVIVEAPVAGYEQVFTTPRVVRLRYDIIPNGGLQVDISHDFGRVPTGAIALRGQIAALSDADLATWTPYSIRVTVTVTGETLLMLY